MYKMLLPWISFLLLATPAVATPVSNLKRQLIPASTIISDIQGIDDGVRALSSFLQTYNGGALAAAPLTVFTGDIHLANRKGFTDANLASPYNSADSNAIVVFTTKTVGKDIPDSVDLLVSKKALFQAAGLNPTVLAGLKLLINDHDTFSEALSSKFTPDAIPAGTAVVAKIHNAIQSGINVYST